MLKKKKENGKEEMDHHNQAGEMPAGESAAQEEAGKDADQAREGGDNSAEVSAEDSLREELASLNDKYLRLFAEFDNFKRRSTRERIELVGTASKSVILSLLPVLDDFDRARKSMETAENVQALREGIELIITKFQNILTQQGVRELKAVGEHFNADLNVAVTSVPEPTDESNDKVVDQLEKGSNLT